MANRSIPTELRKLAGTHPERLNKREARFTRIKSAAKMIPTWFDDVATEEFLRLGPEVIANRLLNTANVRLFAARCYAYSIMVHAANDINARGRNIEIDVFNSKGEVTGVTFKINPSIKDFNAALLVMLRIDDAFGFTPAASTKVNADPPSAEGEDVESIEDFIRSGKESESEVEDGQQRTN